MKYLYYFFSYFLIIILGDLIKVLHIPSIYTLSFIAIIAYDFLAIQYGIKYPLNKRLDINSKSLFIPMSIMSSLLLLFLMKLNHLGSSEIIIVLLTNFFMFYFMKPKRQKDKEISDKNIKEYFESKKH